MFSMQYSDSGWFTCQLYPGSYQNEARLAVFVFLLKASFEIGVHNRDARLFQQEWGFDLLK